MRERTRRRNTVTGCASTEAVLFDFSGTLFDDTGVVDSEALAVAARRRGQPLGPRAAATTCRRLLERADSPEGRRARAGCDLSTEAHRRAWTNLAASTEGVSRAVAEAFYDCVVDPGRWLPYPDAPPTLVALRRGGVSIAVVSNTGWDIRRSFVRAGVYDLVDAFVLSCEYAFEKPDPAIFHLACDLLEAEPGRTLMVGDDPTRDGPAVEAGIATYLLPSERHAGWPRGLHSVLALCGLGLGRLPFENAQDGQTSGTQRVHHRLEERSS